MKTPATQPNTTPALFTHIPRPPTLGGGEHDWQRRFGGHNALVQNLAGFMGVDLRLTVFRNASKNEGELSLTYDINHKTGAQSNITLTADEMQTLACALLDAAHDLRSNPAAPEKAGT